MLYRFCEKPYLPDPDSRYIAPTIANHVPHHIPVLKLRRMKAELEEWLMGFTPDQIDDLIWRAI